MKFFISVIMPVLHENEKINSAIRRINKQHFDAQTEIIVVDGDSKGTTIQSVKDGNAICIKSLPGRARQMNAGAVQACGDVLVFLHCDTALPQDSFGTIRNLLSEGRYDVGAFDLGIDDKDPRFRIIESCASLRSRLTRIPYGDQAFFMKKDFFFKMGMFKEMPLMEDVEFMQRIKKKGKKLFIVPEKVKTSARRWQKEGIVYTTLRNWALMILYLLGVPPEKLVKAYQNHK